MPLPLPRRHPMHHQQSDKNEKKEAEANAAIQAKIYSDEAASHVKAGNYKKAMHCYNMVSEAGGDGTLAIDFLSRGAKKPNPENGRAASWQPHAITPKCRTLFLAVRCYPIDTMPGLVDLAAVAKSSGILATASREAEVLASFTRVDVGNDSDEDKGEEGRPVKKKDEKKKRKDRKGRIEVKDKDEKPAGDLQKPPSPRIPASKSTFAQISKELKARKVAQLQAALKARKNKKKGPREQEIYTDKDRAAAVNLGTKDIKQSLKQKKRADRSAALQIPEEAEPSTLLALGNNELRSGDVKIALNFVNKALELNPGDKNGLVARSKCYLLLGEPQLALQDAETALHSDKAFIRAIYQKAEALYHLGDFEHSLMYYHRGHRLRPELEIFRLGVQKAQEAIENTIGSIPKSAGTSATDAAEEMTPTKAKSDLTTERPGDTNRSDKSSGGSELGMDTRRRDSTRRRSKSAAPATRRGSRNLLDILCSNQEATSVIIAQAEEGIAFLKSRQEFWRQQKAEPAKEKPRRRRRPIQPVRKSTAA